MGSHSTQVSNSCRKLEKEIIYFSHAEATNIISVLLIFTVLYSTKEVLFKMLAFSLYGTLVALL